MRPCDDLTIVEYSARRKHASAESDQPRVAHPQNYEETPASGTEARRKVAGCVLIVRGALLSNDTPGAIRPRRGSQRRQSSQSAEFRQHPASYPQTTGSHPGDHPGYHAAIMINVLTHTTALEAMRLAGFPKSSHAPKRSAPRPERRPPRPRRSFGPSPTRCFALSPGPSTSSSPTLWAAGRTRSFARTPCRASFPRARSCESPGTSQWSRQRSSSCRWPGSRPRSSS